MPIDPPPSLQDEGSQSSSQPTADAAQATREEGHEENSMSRRLVRSATNLSTSFFGNIDSAREFENPPKASTAGPSSSVKEGLPLRDSVPSSAVATNQNYVAREMDGSEVPFNSFLAQSTDGSVLGTSGQAIFTPPPRTEGTVKEQETLDGQEVARLLSNTDTLCFPDNVDFGLSLSETSRLKHLLFDDCKPSAFPWDHLLNFWPQRDTVLKAAANPNSSMAYSEGESSLWFEQWKNVLTRYNSQVWGELALDVEKASVEVDLAKGSSSREYVNLGALQRLQQVLSHLRGV